MSTISPSLILFDVDDTLCDYAGARFGRLRQAFTTAFTYNPDSEVPDNLDELIAESVSLHPHGSDHFAALLGRHGVKDSEAVEAARSWFGRNRFLGLKLFPDAIETLRLIRQSSANRHIGLVTNGPAEVQRDKLNLLGLTPLVDFVVISGEFGIAKPDPAIYREALRLGNSTASDAVFIGDSPEFDISGAQASGIHAIWINRTGASWPSCQPPPDAIVHSLTEARKLLGVE